MYSSRAHESDGKFAGLVASYEHRSTAAIRPNCGGRSPEQRDRVRGRESIGCGEAKGEEGEEATEDHREGRWVFDRGRWCGSGGRRVGECLKYCREWAWAGYCNGEEADEEEKYSKEADSRVGARPMNWKCAAKTFLAFVL